MANISLMEGIKEYVRITNSITKPNNERDMELFNKIINKDNIFNYAPLDLAKLRRFANEVKAEEIETCLEFYKVVAEELGIRCIDTEEESEIDEEDIIIDSEDSEDLRWNTDSKHELGKFFLRRTSFGKEVNAEAIVYTDGTVKILKGSKISEIEADIPSVRRIRGRYRDKFSKGIITDEILCSTPSSAAMIVIGHTANGWIEWKDINGNPLDEYRELIDDLKGAPLSSLHKDDDTDVQEGSSTFEDGQSAEQAAYLEVVSESQKEVAGMQSNFETMPIPKISLSEESIRNLRSIGIELVDRIIKAFRHSNSSSNSNDMQPVNFEVIDSPEPYTEEDRNAEVIGIPFSKVKTAIELGMNILYRGVPGCGKTFAANCDAMAIIGRRSSNRIKQIDFTENTSYSDTMIGLRQSESGRWQYVKGEIARFCEFACHYPDLKFVLILNELTRANTEAVLGQMFTAMENQYRGKEFILDNGDKFICPKNLIIIATMNGTDRGVKKLDKATEERFYIIDVKPLWEEWATNKDAFDNLIGVLGIRLGSDEYNIVSELCQIVAEVNLKCDEGGVLSADNQIGQRQLLQFVGQKDIYGKNIEYNKATLKIVIEQIMSRVKQMADVYNTLQDDVYKLQKLVGKCNE